MNIIYIQDQEIYTFNNRIYHPKSKNYFNRYLTGLASDEKLTVLCYIVERDKETVKKYQEITNDLIEYKGIPDFRKISSYFTTCRIVKKQVKHSGFCYVRTGMSGIIAAHFCRKYHIPYMFIINEDIENNLKTHKKAIVRYAASVIGKMMRHYIKNADYACYVTNKFLQNRYPCNGKTLGCSDIEILEITEESLTAYENKSREAGCYTFGTVGPVDTALKGQDVVITVIKMLKEKGININYQLVGNGSGQWLKEHAKRLGILENVKFMGELSRDNVLEWMKNLDVYIQPSKSEGLPRAVIEAMSCALPCIAADVGGISELISDEYLFHHEGDTEKQIMRIIMKLNDNKLKNMSKENFYKSRNYDPIILDEQRKQFFSRSIDSVRYNSGGAKK